jgi:hypothetical protein
VCTAFDFTEELIHSPEKNWIKGDCSINTDD